jgi:PIN domain nuclease of toxin-antitoxin system
MNRDPALSEEARSAIFDENNKIVVSVASLWEMAIKTNLGKLTPPRSLGEIFGEYRAMGAEVLPITEAHAIGVSTLPNIHRDPFDRLLVAQAMIEGLTIVTDDPFIAQYPVECLW